jgi:hypothetical protein
MSSFVIVNHIHPQIAANALCTLIVIGQHRAYKAGDAGFNVAANYPLPLNIEQRKYRIPHCIHSNIVSDNKWMNAAS